MAASAEQAMSTPPAWPSETGHEATASLTRLTVSCQSVSAIQPLLVDRQQSSASRHPILLTII